MMPATEYEGLPVRKHSVAVRGASGDALNGSFKVEPRDFHPGEPAFMVLEVEPADVNHKPMDESEAWERVQVVRVVRGTFVDPSTALPHLDAVSVALEDLRVKETGQERLNKEAKIAADHLTGLHKSAHKDCDMCQTADPLGVDAVDMAGQVGPLAQQVADIAKKRAEHGDGEGDPENPLPPARTYRKRAPRKPKPKATSTK